MDDLWVAADRVDRAADVAHGVADGLAPKVADGLRTAEDCAWRHPGLPSGGALGADVAAWSGHLTALAGTIAALAGQLRQAGADYRYADASAADDLDRAGRDLGIR
jgi:hypothetical protein